jgi:hypothetical protein
MIEQKEKKKERIDLSLSFFFLCHFSFSSPPYALFFFFLMIDKRLMEQKVFVCSRPMTIDREKKRNIYMYASCYELLINS